MGDQPLDSPAGFLEEDNGNKSSMRLMALIALIAAIIFGVLILLRGDPSGNGLYLTIGFLIAAFCPKAIQKFAEEQMRRPK
jgi:hypothetical protein